MNDERSLLGGIPDFYDLERYLKPQLMTNHTPAEIKELANIIPGETTKDFCKNIINLLGVKVPIKRDGSTNLKFKRTAIQILNDRYRNGCCDASTLFTAIARAKGIPAMQVITYSKENAQACEGTNSLVTRGHFMTGIFDKEIQKWILVDPSQTKIDENHRMEYDELDLVDRNLKKGRYGFAYTEDFRNCELNGYIIDSQHSIGVIQKIVHENLIDKKYYKSVPMKNKIENEYSL